jgi:hypothetical protein
LINIPLKLRKDDGQVVGEEEVGSKKMMEAFSTGNQAELEAAADEPDKEDLLCTSTRMRSE